MLQESKTNELEYQRLSKEEMEQRGILGRLVGICASFVAPTRNGRKYPEELWENVFNDPIMKERIENGVCYGELGHPTDREETDMEKIAVCMAEQPKKGKDGKLRAVFDILNTPNGRILKSLCDYGSTLGISSRGSGDLETDFDGQESVNPDTYTCEGFDVVLIPAVKEARLQYVTEALDKKRYNKTLRERLTESINKETEEHQKVMKESLDTLGINLNEAQYIVTYHDGPTGNKHKNITIDANNSKEADSKAQVYAREENLRADGYTNITIQRKFSENELNQYGAEIIALDGWNEKRKFYLFFIARTEQDVRRYIYDYLIDKVYVNPNGKIEDKNKSSWGKNLSLITRVNMIYQSGADGRGIDVYKTPTSAEDITYTSLHEALDDDLKTYCVEFLYDTYDDVTDVSDTNLRGYINVQANSPEQALDAAENYYTNRVDSDYRYNFRHFTISSDKAINVDTINANKILRSNSLTEGQIGDLVSQTTASGTLVRDSKGKIVGEFPTDDEATEFMRDREKEPELDLYSVDYINQEDVVDSIDIRATSKADARRKVQAQLGKKCLRAIDAKLIEESLNEELYLNKDWKTLKVGDKVIQTNVEFDGTSKWKCIVDKVYDDHIIIKPLDPYLSDMNIWIDDDVVKKQLKEGWVYPNVRYKVHAYPNGSDKLLAGAMNLENAGKLAIDWINHILENPWMSDKEKYDYIKTIYIADLEIEDVVDDIEFSKYQDKTLSELESKINESVTPGAATDDGALMSEIQKLLTANNEMQEKIIALQEKLSVSYTKEVKLEEELNSYKTKTVKLSETAKHNKALNEQLQTVQSNKMRLNTKCEKLTESINRKNQKITELISGIETKNKQIKALKEQCKTKDSKLKSSENTIETLTEKCETLNKDYQQMKESYSKKLEQQTSLVEKYRDIAVKSVNKYIDSQATRLGVTSEEIKNRLPESYSFNDIDTICEDLQQYKLSMSNLPFTTGSRLNEGVRVKATNVSQNTLIPMEDDIDDLTLQLARL